ncbi:hypothetical protein HUF18_12930 [Thalassolituus sp. ST750PaO-4]|uniref:hypothetical protein n=1 Tax=Thalassolituus sp. ST750PaO-4 TaxID=2742965 RepID=UPI001CE2A1C0|nr:hypothetical protein [Thalassolituus sp. ST750PaO-4]MCA6060688.1 hypothetical protein [Thalassolituus sp. ST750PaO-4]
MSDASGVVENKRRITPDNTVLSASSTGGLSVLINWFVLVFDLVPKEHMSVTLSATPVLGIMITTAVSYLWRGFGKDPERLEREQVLKAAISRCKKDMTDDLLSEEEQKKAKEQYAIFKEAYRSIDTLKLK